MRRTTDDRITTDVREGKDTSGTPLVRANRPDARPLRDRSRLVTTRARRGVRACRDLGVAVTLRARRVGSDAGMATAEYAIVTLAAVGFAGLLVVILKSGEVKGLLTGIVRQALSL